MIDPPYGPDHTWCGTRKRSTTAFKVYKIGERSDIESAIGVIPELDSRLNAAYTGESSGGSETGAIYVKTVDAVRDDNGNKVSGVAATTKFYPAGASTINYTIIEIMPSASEYTLRHELARAALCFNGTATTTSSLLAAYGFPLHPSPDDQKAAWLALDRPVNHYLTTTMDRDKYIANTASASFRMR